MFKYLKQIQVDVKKKIKRKNLINLLGAGGEYNV